MQIPLSDVLGDKSGSVKIEESWSKYVPEQIGANAPVEKEFDREKAVMDAIGKTRERRLNSVLQTPQEKPVQSSEPFCHHFFVFKGRKLEYIGSKEIDTSKFAKDISGRFFREWLKSSFPGRKDYDEIVAFDDNMSMKQFASLVNI